MYCVKNDLFGGWTVEWTYRWNEIKNVVSTERGVDIILAGKESKKMFTLFSTGDSLKKILLLPNKQKRNWLAQLMNTLKLNEEKTNYNTFSQYIFAHYRN